MRVDERANADGTRTVRYRAERVTDVAWTAWPGFQVVTRDVAAADASVQVELLLPPQQSRDVDRHFAAIQGALDLFGRWYGAYPWPRLTVVVPPPGAEGAGGMEYPTLVTTGSSTRLPLGLGNGVRELEIVTVHEIAHQWFPIQVQSNEAFEPWLDEGFADYLTTRALARLYGEDRSVIDYPFGKLGYATFHRLNFTQAVRQPLGQPAWLLDQGRYSATVYSKGSLALLGLERTLGDERFTAAMRAYADQWRWRHPSIDDFRAAVEQAADTDLAWFFDAFVRGVRVAEFQATPSGVERVGDAEVPVQVAVTLANGEQRVQTWDARVPRLDVGQSGQVRAVVVDPTRQASLQLDRLDDTSLATSDPTIPLAAAQRWLAFVQPLLQLFGQVG